MTMNATVEYTATAAQTDFVIPYEFLKVAHLVLTIDGTPSTAFSVPDSTTLRLDVAATGGEQIIIQRVTPDTVAGQLVDFSGGVNITAENLDTFTKQMLFIIEEKEDSVTAMGDGTTLPVVTTGDNDDSLYVVGGVWTTRNVTQAKTILGLEHYDTGTPADSEFLVGDGSNWTREAPATARTSMGLGTAATANTGTANGNVPALEDVGGTPGLPAVDGSQLTGLDFGTALGGVKAAWRFSGNRDVVKDQTTGWLTSAAGLIRLNVGGAGSNPPDIEYPSSQSQISAFNYAFTLQPGFWEIEFYGWYQNTQDTTQNNLVEIDFVRTSDQSRADMFYLTQFSIEEGTASLTDDDDDHYVYAVKFFLNVTSAATWEFRQHDASSPSGTADVQLKSGRAVFTRVGVAN